MLRILSHCRMSLCEIYQEIPKMYLWPTYTHATHRLTKTSFNRVRCCEYKPNRIWSWYVLSVFFHTLLVRGTRIVFDFSSYLSSLTSSKKLLVHLDFSQLKSFTTSWMTLSIPMEKAVLMSCALTLFFFRLIVSLQVWAKQSPSLCRLIWDRQSAHVVVGFKHNHNMSNNTTINH